MVRGRRFGERESRSDGRMNLALSVPGEQLKQPRRQQIRLVPHVPEVHTEKRFVVVDEAWRREAEERRAPQRLHKRPARPRLSRPPPSSPRHPPPPRPPRRAGAPP